MKKIITLLFVLFTLLVHSQLRISTNFRQDGLWHDDTGEWEILSTDESGTLFAFNAELTTFKHTTPTITSNYFITNWDYSEENVTYSMTVTSDVGNEYEMLIDGINNCVCFFYWYNDNYYMVRHTIKSSWIEE